LEVIKDDEGRCAARRGAWGEAHGTRAQIGRPQAGKTGTTNDLTDAWFVGYTPDLAAAVWLGDPDERRAIENVGGFGRVFGGTLPAVTWREVARALLDDVEPRQFLEPGAGRSAGRAPGPPTGRDQPSPTPSPVDEVEPHEPDDVDESPPPDDGEDDDRSRGPCIPPIFTSGC
jgi:penicillin-binding protein 1A